MNKRPVKDTAPEKYAPENFFREVYAVVAAIPCGRVVSYGDIARLLGQSSRSRMVGRALKNAPDGLPCHRVVNSQGRLVPGWTAQRRLLADEGATFLSSGRVDLKACRWRFEEDEAG